jgi:(E)-4-hydroxy-3-methylbut-2-enyl-diphosphate synthase
MNTGIVRIGGVEIGSDRPVAIQSMTKTDTRDVAATVCQINELAAAGCEIVRVSVADMEAAHAVGEIRRAVKIPLAADIHFDYRLALESIRQGVDKVRINPGNIGDRLRVKQVADAARERGIPIRIGVNGGSLDAVLFHKYGGVTAEALVESAVDQADMLSMCGFNDIVVSIKTSDVYLTVEACRLFHEKKTGIPQHIGITEAGAVISGLVKSTVGMYELLSSGIGDTIRISLSGDPVGEVIAAKTLLQTMAGANIGKIRQTGGVELISCPTCGRCRINITGIINEIERRTSMIHTNRHIKVAVMGCAVNGPGESRGADVGITGGDGKALLFKKGVPQYQVPESDLVETLIKEIHTLII